MWQEMAITDARHQLTALPRRLAQRPGAVAVTKRGRPVLAVLPWEMYEALVETLDIMSDPSFEALLRQGVQEMDAGKGIPWERAKRSLG